MLIMLVAVAVLGLASPALAGRADPIREPFPTSDAQFVLALVADGFTTPVLEV